MERSGCGWQTLGHTLLRDQDQDGVAGPLDWEEWTQRGGEGRRSRTGPAGCGLLS